MRVSEEAAIEALLAKITLLKQILANLVATKAYKRTDVPPVAAQTAPTDTPVATNPACPQITEALRVGSASIEVLPLQRFFMRIGFLPEASDTGSFDVATEAAVQRFQAREGIVSSGTATTTGYGMTGPKTRAALAQCTITADADMPAATPFGIAQ